MIMRTKILLLLSLTLGVATLKAETVRWMVQPNYESITHYSTDIFRCIGSKGGIHLIDWDGKELLPPNINADAITMFSDGFAIVLQEKKILGFLSEVAPHHFQHVNGDYYITKYPYFSEGYLTVAQGSENGKQGYMDSAGQIVLECSYLETMPVRQGWAVMEENSKDSTHPRRYKRSNDFTGKGMDCLPNGEKFVWATSFNSEGLALAKVRGGKFVIFDTKFHVVKNDVKKVNKESVDPYDYSFRPNGNGLIVPPANAEPVADANYTTFEQNGKMGYKTSAGDVVAPAQFDNAESICNARSIVLVEGKYGVVELLEGDFDPVWPDNKCRYYVYSKDTEQLEFSLSVPSVFDSDKIKLEFDCGDGNYVVCKEGLAFGFKVAPQIFEQKKRICTLRGKATYVGDGQSVLLWEDSWEMEISCISLIIGTPTVTAEYADEHDNQTVKVVITNTSDEEVSVSASLNVAGKNTPFNGKLEPDKSKTIMTTVKVDESKKVQATASAKVDGKNCGSKQAQINLKKI